MLHNPHYFTRTTGHSSGVARPPDLTQSEAHGMQISLQLQIINNIGYSHYKTILGLMCELFKCRIKNFHRSHASYERIIGRLLSCVLRANLKFDKDQSLVCIPQRGTFVRILHLKQESNQQVIYQLTEKHQALFFQLGQDQTTSNMIHTHALADWPGRQLLMRFPN